MVEEKEIPECCLKYDKLYAEQCELANENDSIRIDVDNNTETIKEYLQIIKDSNDVGISLEYYKKQIHILDTQLCNNEVKSKENDVKIAELQSEINNCLDQIQKIRWGKFSGWGVYGWYNLNSEEGESMKNKVGVVRVVP